MWPKFSGHKGNQKRYNEAPGNGGFGVWGGNNRFVFKKFFKNPRLIGYGDSFFDLCKVSGTVNLSLDSNGCDDNN
jgi:hypothetical protein